MVVAGRGGGHRSSPAHGDASEMEDAAGLEAEKGHTTDPGVDRGARERASSVETPGAGPVSLLRSTASFSFPGVSSPIDAPAGGVVSVSSQVAEEEGATNNVAKRGENESAEIEEGKRSEVPSASNEVGPAREQHVSLMAHRVLWWWSSSSVWLSTFASCAAPSSSVRLRFQLEEEEDASSSGGVRQGDAPAGDAEDAQSAPTGVVEKEGVTRRGEAATDRVGGRGGEVMGAHDVGCIGSAEVGFVATISPCSTGCMVSSTDFHPSAIRCGAVPPLRSISSSSCFMVVVVMVGW